MEQVRSATERPSLPSLRAIAILAGLEDRVLDQIAAIAETRSHEPGTRLFDQGQMNVPFMIPLSGQISVFRTAPDWDRDRHRRNPAPWACRTTAGADPTARADRRGNRVRLPDRHDRRRRTARPAAARTVPLGDRAAAGGGVAGVPLPRFAGVRPQAAAHDRAASGSLFAGTGAGPDQPVGDVAAAVRQASARGSPGMPAGESVACVRDSARHRGGNARIHGSR